MPGEPLPEPHGMQAGVSPLVPQRGKEGRLDFQCPQLLCCKHSCAPSPGRAQLSAHILQAGTLEWVAISHRGDLAHPEIEPRCLASLALVGGFFTAPSDSLAVASFKLQGESLSPELGGDGRQRLGRRYSPHRRRPHLQFFSLTTV